MYKQSDSDNEFDDIEDDIDVNESIIFFQEDSSPMIQGMKTVSPVNFGGRAAFHGKIEEFNILRNSEQKNASSYGELPKFNKRCDGSTRNVMLTQKSMSELKQKVLAEQCSKIGSETRNASEVFNYRMKTQASKKSQNLKPAIRSRDVNQSDVQKSKDYTDDKHSDLGSSFKIADQTSQNNIAKSRSHQQFLNLKKQSSYSNEYMKHDDMYLSIGQFSIKPTLLSQAQDSFGEPSHYKYDSAFAEKQSELSSSTTGVDKQSIKVIARLRPLNTLEQELQLFNPKRADMITLSDDEKTIIMKEEFHTYNSNLNFTFDHVFSPQSSQVDVYNTVGGQVIDDIMCGYNGTIFAYGQTGSGKTYTMYGDDIFDESIMGIVPRAARQIFEHIRGQDLEVEYSIRVQMVEIYKESLRDLLCSQGGAPDLKIKEDPKRGTYVEGLQDMCVVSEDELMAAICRGETMRHVASTAMNQHSSRSHSICMIEVVQKYPNDSEKRGVLNLVDLAGSERVSKSLASGALLEEAKKINFSLSMLGKVINSLVKNSPHIPYRDSKLTRLLKESLGGNNKTSLIVACSMHYSNYEETLSSLRFAQSAKHIQNKVRLNIKTSNDQLFGIIEQLKFELKSAKEEIYRLRLSSSNHSQILANPIDTSEEVKQCDDEKQVIFNNNQSILGSTPLQAVHNLPHQSLLSKNYNVIETNNKMSPKKIHKSSKIVSSEELDMKLKSKEADIGALVFQKDELQVKVMGLEDKVNGYKQKMLALERRVVEYETENDIMFGKNITKDHKITFFEKENQILKEQVSCLEKALIQSELANSKLQLEKQGFYQKSIGDFLDSSLKILNVPVSKGLDNLMCRAKQNKDCFLSQLNIEQDFNQEVKVSQDSIQQIPLNSRDMLMQNLYTLEMFNAVEEGSMTPEITIYLLKNQLIEASLANHNLQRILGVNRWRQVIEFGKYKAANELCKLQGLTINTLQKLLEKTRTTHDKLKRRFEKFELLKNAQNNLDHILMTDAESNIGSLGGDPLTYRSGFHDRQSNQFKTNIHSQSIVSSSQNNGNQQVNQKSRFKKIITSKSVRRLFALQDRSPGSRVSLGGRSQNTQSIMTQYYNLKHHPTYNLHQQLSQVDSNALSGSGESTGNNKQSPLIKIEDSNQGPFEVYNPVDRQNLQAQRLRAVSHFTSQGLTSEDLKFINFSQNLQEVKDYLNFKFGSASQDTNKNLLEHQNLQKRHNKSSSPRGKRLEMFQAGVVDNEPRYRVSDTSEVQKEAANHLNNINDDSEIQEVHMLRNNEPFHTHDSEYLQTNGSLVGGPGGFFGMTTNQQLLQHQQNENTERLQERIQNLIEEASNQRIRAEEYKKAYYDSKTQMELGSKLMEQKEVNFNIMIKDEMYQWEQAINQLKTLNESELQRKQREIQKLHELLAKWIDNYQAAALEIKRGAHPDIEILVTETQQKVHQNYLNEVMLTNLTPANTRNPQRLDFRTITNEMNTVVKSKIRNHLLRSPQQCYNLQTPQVKINHHHSLMTEQHHDKSLRGSQPSIASQRKQLKYHSPNPLMTENCIQQELRVGSQRLKGDTSPPAHHNVSSNCSLSDDESPIKIAFNSSMPHIDIAFNSHQIVEPRSDESSQIMELNLQSQSHQALDSGLTSRDSFIE